MPGAASVVAMNNYVNRVPRDGTTVLVGTGQLLVRLLLGLDGARAKVFRSRGLGGDPMGRITYASPASAIKTRRTCSIRASPDPRRARGDLDASTPCSASRC